MRDVLREEKKYLIDVSEALCMRTHLATVMDSDVHNGKDGYCVRSLYFDTPEDRDYQEKEDGIELRRKLRMRIYHPKDEFAMLEMKQKQGQYQRKRSLRLTREQAQAIIDGDYSVLLRCDSMFGIECYTMLQTYQYRPKVIVEYDRFAFTIPENSTRITFDSAIRGNEINYNIFASDLMLNSVMQPFGVVLEVKFNGFLFSYLKDMLLPVQKSEISVSKYCMARQAGRISSWI